jgi:hypothetical protein
MNSTSNKQAQTLYHTVKFNANLDRWLLLLDLVWVRGERKVAE